MFETYPALVFQLSPLSQNQPTRTRGENSHVIPGQPFPSLTEAFWFAKLREIGGAAMFEPCGIFVRSCQKPEKK